MTDSSIQPIGASPTKPGIAFTHIDDFLDCDTLLIDHPELAYPHFMFTYFRYSAVVKMAYAAFMRQFKLFADYEGKTYRIVGASRMGDVWLSERFDQENGYSRRVDPDFTKFSNWRDYADRTLTWPERVQIGVKFYGLEESVTSGIPKICNRLTSFLQRAGAPKQYLDCTPEQRAFLSSLQSK